MKPAKAVFELGLNHFGAALRARRMIDVMAAQGATHVTVQVVVDPERFTRDKASADFLRPNCLSLEENLALVKYARGAGLEVGATVVDLDDVAPLVQAGVHFFKILSSDITYAQLHHEVARTSLPFYLSTGASTLTEIVQAVESVRTIFPSADIRLIHTVLQVPTRAQQLNLANIPFLAGRLNLPVSYGQHSDISEAMWTAIAVGAETIFVYVAEEPAPNLPDGPHSISCKQTAEVLQKIDLVRTMLGNRERTLSSEDQKARSAIRRSVVAARDIKAGERITKQDIAFKRPGTGRNPWEMALLIGRCAERNYRTDDDLFPGAAADSQE